MAPPERILSPRPAFCICADARMEEAYRDCLRGERAALLLTDPPYCLLTRRRKGGDLREPRGRKIDHDIVLRFETVRDYRLFTEAWLPKAVGHLASGAPLCLWTNFLGKEPLLSVARSLGYANLWGELLWAKPTTDRAGGEQFLRVYETALLLGTKPLPALRPEDLPRTWSAVAGYDEDGEAARFGSHPHHKPFSVLEPLIRAWSRPGDLLLDPFAGSGSIPAAARRLSRRCASMEADPTFAARVRQRLSST